MLVFYPFAFSPVCTDQLQVYEEGRPDLATLGATLYGVSCDSIHAQRAFREKLGVSIEQLSDFHPKGAVSQAFGRLVRARRRVAPRARHRRAGRRSFAGATAPTSLDELPGLNLIFDALAAPAA